MHKIPNLVMRFKTKFVFSEPIEGTTRLRRVFAWLPIVIAGDRVWLEHYEQLQGYIKTEYKVSIDGEPKAVLKGEWITLSKRVIS